MRAVDAAEDQDMEEDLFNNPFGTLVKNCNMLHNIVGPACIFLKQGFSQTLVCNRAQSVQAFSSIHKCPFIPSVTHSTVLHGSGSVQNGNSGTFDPWELLTEQCLCLQPAGIQAAEVCRSRARIFSSCFPLTLMQLECLL